MPLSLPGVIKKGLPVEQDDYHVECCECGVVCGQHIKNELGSLTFGTWRAYYQGQGWELSGSDWTCPDCQE